MHPRSDWGREGELSLQRRDFQQISDWGFIDFWLTLIFQIKRLRFVQLRHYCLRSTRYFSFEEM